jgi:hypothetical protein
VIILRSRRSTHAGAAENGKISHDDWDLAEWMHRDIFWRFVPPLGHVHQDELERDLLFGKDHRDEAAAASSVRYRVEFENHVEYPKGTDFWQ